MKKVAPEERVSYPPSILHAPSSEELETGKPRPIFLVEKVRRIWNDICSNNEHVNSLNGTTDHYHQIYERLSREYLLTYRAILGETNPPKLGAQLGHLALVRALSLIELQT